MTPISDVPIPIAARNAAISVAKGSNSRVRVSFDLGAMVHNGISWYAIVQSSCNGRPFYEKFFLVANQVQFPLTLPIRTTIFRLPMRWAALRPGAVCVVLMAGPRGWDMSDIRRSP